MKTRRVPYFWFSASFAPDRDPPRWIVWRHELGYDTGFVHAVPIRSSRFGWIARRRARRLNAYFGRTPKRIETVGGGVP